MFICPLFESRRCITSFNVIHINISSKIYIYIYLVTVVYLSVSCLRPDGAELEESQCEEVNLKTFHKRRNVAY